MVYGIPAHRLMRGRGKIAPLSSQAPEPQAASEVAPTPEPPKAHVPAPEPAAEVVPEPEPVADPVAEPVAEPEAEAEPEPDLPDPASLTAASPKAQVVAVALSLGIDVLDHYSKKELLALIRAKIKGE